MTKKKQHFKQRCHIGIWLMILAIFTAIGYAKPDNIIREADYMELLEAAAAMLQNESSATTESFVDKYFHADTLQRWNGEGRSRYIGWLNAEKYFHKALTLYRLESVSAEQHQIQAKVLSEATGLLYHLTLNVTEKAPLKIRGLSIRTPEPSPSDSKAPLSKQEAAAALSAYIGKLGKQGTFSGAVLLADDKGILVEASEGLAERRFGIANNLDTKFNIGSMSKMFTAVSILQLAETGKLGLKDKLTKYIDRSLFAEGDFDAITIEQLLSHTAGLGRPDFPKTHPNDLRHLQDFRSYLQYLPLVSKPGSQYRYSGDGFILLGMIIEAVSGMDFDDYLQTHIFHKANMKHSGNFDIDGVTPNMAMGYFYSDQLKSMQSNWFLHAVRGNAAGGSYSTVKDLYQFASALTHQQLLSAPSAEMALSAKPELNSPDYGFGFIVRNTDNGKVVGHNGAYIGVSAELRMYLDKGYTLVVLANQASMTDPIIAVAESLLKRIE